jgi:hypothetical protein
MLSIHVQTNKVADLFHSLRIILIGTLFLSGFFYFLWYPFSPRAAVLGPLPEEQMAGTQQGAASVLGSVDPAGQDPSSAASPGTTAAQPQGAAPDPADSSTTTIGATPSTAANSHVAIAAGGGLVYLGTEDLEEYFRQLREFGSTWVRWDIDWSEIQVESAERYDWEASDRVADMAKKYGIKSLAVITYAPGWAQEEGCPAGRHCPPSQAGSFARFAGIAAAHYAVRIDAWEIWNEPNYEASWYPAADAEAYAALLVAASAAIKEAAPHATVISGGLATIGSDDGSNLTMATFVRTLYRTGANQTTDALAIHPYTYPYGTTAAVSRNGWQELRSLRQLMESGGDASKKIWITEYGAPTGGPGSVRSLGDAAFTLERDFLREEDQKQLAEDVIGSYREQRAYLGPLFWYSLRDEGTDSSTTENFFGLLRADGSPKPAYPVLREAF